VIFWWNDPDRDSRGGGIADALNQSIFGRWIPAYFGDQEIKTIGIDNSPIFMLSLLFSPADLKRAYQGFEWPQIEYMLLIGTAQGKLGEEDLERSVGRVKMHFKEIFSVLDAERKATVRTKWITAEIDRITALFYFVIVISLFIISILVSLFYPVFFQHFTQNFPNVEVKVVITILSSAGLFAVIIMLRFRIKGLRDKASTVMRYLLALESIKIVSENFKITLQDIERYLNEDNWILADYWVRRVLSEYQRVFYDQMNQPREPLKKQ
jgi:hypothetical protein